MSQEVINKCLDHFKTIYPDVIIPPIIQSLTMRTTAGRVKFDHITRQVKHISLNMRLLVEESQIESTLLHELAHVADWYVYKKIGHGRTWRHIMSQLGHEPKRCHNYDTSSLKRRHQRVAKVQCQCQVIEITNIRLKKIQQGTSYRCKACHGPLKLVT